MLLSLKGGEESIKRQLQAVAEGVAASVLQSSFSEKPTEFSGDHIDSHGATVDPKIEVDEVYFFPVVALCPLIGCKYCFLYYGSGCTEQTIRQNKPRRSNSR